MAMPDMAPTEDPPGTDSAAAARTNAHTGGTLISAGSASWMVHGILMIVAFGLLISLLSAGSLTQIIQVGQAAFYSYIGATVTILMGSFLLAAGLFLFQKGTPGLSWSYGDRTYEVSPKTRTKAKLAAVFIAIHGALGIVAIVGISSLLSAGAALDTNAAFGWIQTILWSWLIATLVLVIGAFFFMSFARGMKTELSSPESTGGVGFFIYAIMNFIGTAMFAGVFLFVLADPFGASLGAVVPLALGAFLQFLFVPILGIVIFALMTVAGRKWRTIKGEVPAPAAPTYYAPPAPPAPAPFAPAPPAPLAPGPPVAEAASEDAEAFEEPPAAE